MIVENKVTEPLIQDVQGQSDDRDIYINEVGISDLRLPVTLAGCEDNTDSYQNVHADISLGVDLSRNKKGIHMSRLVETVLEHSDSLNLSDMDVLLRDIMKRQDATRACVKFEFDYFFKRKAPVTQKPFPQSYRCSYEGTLSEEGITLSQSVTVPVQTLCPCSKEISDYGAHNQRSKIWIRLNHISAQRKPEIEITLEEIISIAEASASSPLYTILKREDERFITMSAYDKPCFVEDVVRNVSSKLHKDQRFSSYEIRTVNFESIHSHNAFAVIRNP